MNIFKDILGLLKTEEGPKVVPLLAQTLLNVASNPTPAGLSMAGGQFLAQLVLSQIPIGAEVLQKVASDVVGAHQAATGVTPAPTPAPQATPAPSQSPFIPAVPAAR